MEELTIEGELLLTLHSKRDWINKIPRWLPEKKSRAEQRIWLDKNGNALTIGEDFSAAEDKGSYPVKNL